VAESFILPKLQEALNQLEMKGVKASMLLCAGTFADLNGSLPLYVPFRIGCAILGALNIKSIGLITPVKDQVKNIQERWEKMGWRSIAWTDDLSDQDARFFKELSGNIHANDLDCIVLDYVGFPVGQVLQLQKSIQIPVFDLGQLTMMTLASTLQPGQIDFGGQI
jgi:hypothetical protein